MIYAWTALDHTPEWEFIEVTAKHMTSIGRFDMESCDNALFDQTHYLQKYATKEKIQSWEENAVVVDERWVECFKHFAKNNIPYDHLMKIVSNVLCLSGTSASVDGCFEMNFLILYCTLFCSKIGGHLIHTLLFHFEGIFVISPDFF